MKILISDKLSQTALDALKGLGAKIQSNPAKSVRSVALCTADDSVLRPLLERFPGMEVVVMPRKAFTLSIRSCGLLFERWGISETKRIIM